MSSVRYFLCPMSKNIVDAILRMNRGDIGLLPSRRQIDVDGGYVGWTTQQFAQHINNRILVERDHGGEGQGKTQDDGRKSYTEDTVYMDIIHVDPWKTCLSKEEGLQKTIADILFINKINPKMKFEVGTEQAIFPLSSNDLSWFLTSLKKALSDSVFNNIEYVVIQSGVGLDVVHEVNTGMFNLQKLINEVSICNTFGKKSKEHNGDFLSSKERNLRFNLGLSAINIGPELSIFENTLYMHHLRASELRDMNQLCYESGFWKKWIKESDKNIPNIYFKVCAHYNYSRLHLLEIDAIDSLTEKILTIVDKK